MKTLEGVTIVNNTCQDISIVKHYFEEWYLTGILHEDVADLFEVKIYNVKEETYPGEKVRLIVDFLDD